MSVIYSMCLISVYIHYVYCIKYFFGNSRSQNTCVGVSFLVTLQAGALQLYQQLSRGVLRKGILKKCSKFTGEHPCRSCKVTLLKSHFGMGVLLYICCIFSEHLFLKTPVDGCFCSVKKNLPYQNFLAILFL